MISRRSAATLLVASGLCAVVVVGTSFVASGRRGRQDTHNVTRSALSADYSEDTPVGSAPLSPMAPEVAQAATRDQERLGQTELRITTSSRGGGASAPLLESFQPGPAKVPSSSSTGQTPQTAGAPVRTPAAAPTAAVLIGAGSPAQTPPEYSNLSPITCTQQYTTRSVSSSAETSILFRNRSAQELKVYWLNLSGNPAFRGDLGAGGEVLLATYAGHAWMVTDSNGNCRVIFSARLDPGVAVIEPR